MGTVKTTTKIWTGIIAEREELRDKNHVLEEAVNTWRWEFNKYEKQVRNLQELYTEAKQILEQIVGYGDCAGIAKAGLETLAKLEDK